MTTNNSHPDADVYPHATGLAARMVEEHSKEEPVKLYSAWFCPFVQRVLLILLEKNIPFQYIEVNPYHKPDSLLRVNPRGLVPTLQYEDKALYESNVLCVFLEDAYPSHYPRLLPREPFEKARMMIWIDYITTRIIPSYHRYLQYQPTSPSDSKFSQHRAEFLSHLSEITSEMDDEGPFFSGPKPSLIDFMLAPWALRLWVFDEYKGGLEMSEMGATQQRWENWVAAIEQNDSVKMSMSDREHYLPIYRKYAEDKAQSELAKATREGRGVP